ncbi:MAG: rhomboid family intramembrane serine protease [Silanimonas sp.]|nr:MAG: rhomboid family intramembrane serine protease [Silanimonas sp.]
MPRLPPATLSLLWIITGGFVLQLLAGPAMLQWFALWPVGSEALGGPGFLPWQLLSYAALHGDFIHLFFNGLMLWMLGAVLESTWGTRRYVQFALACVLAAGLTQLVLGALGVFPPRPTVGISGLTFGLLLAYGMMFPNQQLMLLIPPVPVRAKYLVLIFAAIALLMGLSGASGIAHFAHLGGMAGGWLMIRYWRGQPPFGRRGPRIVR